MDSKEMLRKMRAAEFRRNNGMVLRTINLLRHEYMRLASALDVLKSELDERDFWDCINFLQEAGYIILRDETHTPVELADARDRGCLEARLSALGIRLMGGEIHDKMIEK